MKDLGQVVPLDIRRVTGQDIGRIAAIQAASPEAAQWDPPSYLNNDVWVAAKGSAIVGFLATRQTAPGENEILNLAVDPAARRMGVGYRLVRQALESRSGEWFLEVRASNVAAIRLYEDLGFVRSGTRENYYGEPPEAAIVMRFFS